MPIDPNIILQGRPSVQLLNPMDVASQAMNMRRLSQQNQEYDAGLAKAKNMKSLYAKNVVTDANGNKSLNQQGILSDLAESAPEDHAEVQKKFNLQNLEQSKYYTEQKSMIIKEMNDEPSYFQGRERAIKLGLPGAKDIPEQYPGQEAVEKMKIATMSQSENLQQQWKQVDQQFREKELVSRSLDRKEARDERRFQSGIKLDEKTQGLKTPYGLANTTDDAKQLKDAHETKLNFDSKLDQMIALRTKKEGGAVLDREAVQRGKQLSKDLLLEYKNMAKLGVLSKSDEDIINAIIPEDPLEYNSPLAAIQGQDPILNRLKSFKADSDKDFKNRISTRTRSGIQESLSGGEPSAGTIRMTDGKGGFFDIPKSQYGEAISSGLKKGG